MNGTGTTVLTGAPRLHIIGDIIATQICPRSMNIQTLHALTGHFWDYLVGGASQSDSERARVC